MSNYMITTYGGGDAFYYVFQGIAALMDPTGGFMNNIFRLGGTVGILWVFVMVAFKNAWEQAFLWLFWFMTATLVLFAPKATVWIKDPMSFQAPRKVDNVPFALAAFAGVTSQIGTALTEKMESLFTLPDYLPYHQTGTVFASKLMMKARQIKITDPEFKANMERFVNRCVVYDTMIGLKYTMKELQRTPDVWGLVSARASPVLGFLYKEPGAGNRGEIVTCQVGAQKLHNLWQGQLDEAALIYGSGFFKNNPREAFNTYLPQSFQMLTKISTDASKLLQQEMMLNAIRDGSQNKLDELRGSVGYATAKALINQEMNNRTMGEVASEMLVIAKAVIEALCYASFIFVVILSLVHNGYRILWNYMGVLMWLQMWAPLYAVLNLFMSLYGQYRCSGMMIGGGLTMMNSAGLTQVNAQVASMAGWLSCSLPFLAYGIVKGGVGSFMHIAGNIVSSSQGAVSSAASEAASGNITMGNVTMGTQAYQNMNAFQHNTAPSHRSGSFDQILDDGTSLITQADGRQIFVGGAGKDSSILSIKSNLNSNLSKQIQEGISHQTSNLESLSEEYSQSRMSAARQVVNLAQSWGKGQNGSDGFSHDNSVGDNKSLSQTSRFTKSLEDRFGFSERQAADLTASIVAGAGVPGIAKLISGMSLEGKAQASFSSGASRDKAVSDMTQMAKDMGISNSLDEATRSLRDYKFGNSQSQEARLAQDIGHTMEKSDSLRSSMGKTQQIIDSYNKSQSLMQSGSLNMDRDQTQQLLEFTAKEMKNGRPMGMHAAKYLLTQGGPEADVIQARFAEAKFNQIKSSIEAGMPIQSEADVKALYNNTPTPGGSNAQAIKQEVDGTLKGVTASSIHAQGDAQGLTRPIDRLPEDMYYQQKAQVKGQIGHAEQNLSTRGQNMQDKTDQTMDRSVLGAATFNAGDSLGDIYSAINHADKTLKNMGKTIVDPSTYTSNFKRPSEEGSSPQADQSWKWKRVEGSSGNDNTFPGTQGNTVIIQKDNVSPTSQNSMSSRNLNVSNNVSHQITNQSQTTMAPKGSGVHPKIKPGGEPVISENTRVDLNSSGPKSSSSSIKQSNVVKGGK